MFYSQHVLTKKGPLAKIWLAAHMQNKLTKAMVFSTDVRKAVESIISPEVPMALRLTSNLLLGVARILYRKTKYLLQESSDAMTRLKLTFRPGAAPDAQTTRTPTTATYNAVTLQPSVDTLAAPNLDLDLLPARPATNTTSFLAADRDITIDEFAGGLMGGMLDAFALDPELERHEDLGADLAEPLLFTPSERPSHLTPQASSVRSDPSTERMRADSGGPHIDTPVLGSAEGAPEGARAKISVMGTTPQDPEVSRAATTSLAPEPMDFAADNADVDAPPPLESITPVGPGAPDEPMPSVSGSPSATDRDRLSVGLSGERGLPRLSTGTDDFQLGEGAAETPVGAAETPVSAAETPIGAAETPVGAAETPTGAAETPAGATDMPTAPGTPVPMATVPVPGTPATPVPGTPAAMGDVPATSPIPATPATPTTPRPDAPVGDEGLGSIPQPSPTGVSPSPMQTPTRRESAAWEPTGTPSTPDTPGSTPRESRKRKAHALTDVGATELSASDFRACLNDTSDLIRDPRAPTRRRIQTSARYEDVLGRPVVTLAPALRELFEQSFQFQERVGSPMTDADIAAEGDDEEAGEGEVEREGAEEGEKEDLGATQEAAEGEDADKEGEAGELGSDTEEPVDMPLPFMAAGDMPAQPIIEAPFSPVGEMEITPAEEAEPVAEAIVEPSMAEPPTVEPSTVEPPTVEPSTVEPPSPGGETEMPDYTPAVTTDPEPPEIDFGPSAEEVEPAMETESMAESASEPLPAADVQGPFLSEVSTTRAQVDQGESEELTEATVSARTRKMQEYIVAHLQDEELDYSARLVLEKPISRRTVARTFYELLNLSSKKAVRLKQETAFGTILVSPVQPAFDSLAAVPVAEVAEAQ